MIENINSSRIFTMSIQANFNVVPQSETWSIQITTAPVSIVAAGATDRYQYYWRILVRITRDYIGGWTLLPVKLRVYEVL